MNKLTITATNYYQELAEALAKIAPRNLEDIGATILESFDRGQKIFIAGNGGSAATASHMACDFAKTTLGKGTALTSKRIKAIALSDNVPAITAWGNDVSYDRVFSEQLRTLADHDDLLIVISASGNSSNIIECLRAAKEISVKTIGLLGFDGGKSLALCEQAIVIDSKNYGIIEDAHSILNHLLTEWMKEAVQKNT